MSYFQKSVCLREWWLVKADKDYDGRRLAVAGITSGEKQAVRVFSSAPILKRHDVFTLETVDGIFVIVQGFINKTISQENGFPSEVCQHFVFGFPPSWETFSRKCSEGDSALRSDAQSNSGFKRLSPQAASSSMTKNFDKASSESETQESSESETQECSKEKNLDVKSSSESGEKETKYNPGHEKAISSFDSNASGVSERKTSLVDYSVEDSENFVLSGSHFNVITAKSLQPSGLEKKSDLSFIKGFANDTENENHIGKTGSLKILQEHCSSSPLSACHLMRERGCSNSLQSAKHPSEVNSIKKLAKQIVFSRETDLSEEPSSCAEGRGTACSQKKVQRKSKNNQMSCAKAKLKDERRMSVSALKCSGSVGNPRVNLDDRPSGKSTLNPPGDEFQEPIDQLASRNPDARSFEDIVELDCGVCLASKDTEHDAHDSVLANGTKQNESDGYITTLSGSNADKEKGKKGSTKRSNSQSENFIRRKSRRKSLYNSERENLSQRKSMRKMDGLISEKEKEESSIKSPESLCLKKSRSGRWLLPTLEFWRNQRVIYDADHRIRGIKDLS